MREPGAFLRDARPAAAPQYAAGSLRDDATQPDAASVGWRDYFTDPDLQALIAKALLHNRDLRTAVLRVEEARAAHAIERSAGLPSIGLQGDGSRARIPADLSPLGVSSVSRQFQIAVGISSWEIDFWSAVRNRNDAALQSYLATDAARRAATLALIAQVADSYLGLREVDERLALVFRLGIKELWSLWRDPIMLVFVDYTFTVSVYTSASAMPESLHNAPIAIVDEDASPLSARIASVFYPPAFTRAAMISLPAVDPGMDAGIYTFGLTIPSGFQRDVLAGKPVVLQLNVDATRMSQAFTGSGYIQQIVAAEVNEFTQRYRSISTPPVDLALRARFNPALKISWFGSVMGIINNVTMVSILLTGAALIREREHGTIEHLLVMPITPAEIMSAKVWSAAPFTPARWIAGVPAFHFSCLP